MLIFNDQITIEKLHTFYYFEFAKDYVFKGEKHNFWEAVYVDKGILEVMADTRHYILKAGQMIFHQPEEFHALWANGEIAPNVIVFSFDCQSPNMDFFRSKILQLNNNQRDILQLFIREARTVLSEHAIVPHAAFGANQLLKLYLEQFFIHCIRQHDIQKPKESIRTKKRMEKDIAVNIETYLKDCVDDNLCLQDMVNHMHLSATYLKNVFKVHYHESIMRYYRHLRIESAKTYIRESSYSFTEIAALMHYTSVHYFSKQFKDSVGMTPTEYANSLVHY